MTKEETQIYTNFVYQVMMTERMLDHCNESLKEHKCNAERKIIKALMDHSVGIDAYHSESIVGNHCMHFESKGDQIMNVIYKVMLPKISDASNKFYLQTLAKQ